MNLKKLIDIQSKLIAPKNQVNKFGWYRYRSCEDILTAVKPLLEEQKVSLVISDDIVQLENRYYVKATCTLIDWENWEVIASASALAREAEDKKWMDVSQITGAASSYARKYALNGLLCIDDTKDADAQTPQSNDVSLASMSVGDIITTLGNCKTSTELSTYSSDIIKLKQTLSDADYQSIKEAYNNKLKELK